MFETMEEVIEAHEAADKHFFDESAMRFFNSKIESELIEGKYFVTSAYRLENDPKRYTVRKVNADATDISTVGKFQEFESLKEALEFIDTL